ncbi:MAG: hypothetical protein IJQ20_08875 [Paludibacteraceae bacterium]|nr:hypothetical protein [Paludibacteraceae bacterium]
MKKKIFVVGALAIIAMSAMFMACSGKNEPTGCTCVLDNGDRIYASPYEMQQMGMTSCAQFAAALGGARCW